MEQQQLDVFTIFGDLKKKIIGIDPATQKEPAGFFVTLNEQPEPVSKTDYDNPVQLSGVPTAPYVPAAGMSAEDIESAKTDFLQRSIEARRKLNVLTDRVLEINDKYLNINGSAKISDAWQAIIKGATSIAETKQLNPETQAKLDNALKVLFTVNGEVKEPSPKYKAYKEYKAKFEDAKIELDRIYSEYAGGGAAKLEKWRTEGKVHQGRVKDAENDWNAFGYRNEIEEALFTQSGQGVDPSAFLISMAKDEFDKYVFAITANISSPFIEVLPGDWYNEDTHAGWITYSSNKSSTDSGTTTSDSNTKAGAHYFFYAKAHYSDSSKDTEVKLEASSFHIKCSYKTVHISYPWMESVLLRMGGWFLKGDYAKNCISDGSDTQKSTDAGRKNEEMFLPCIPTQMILIRDLVITCDFSEETKSTISKVKSGGGGLSFMGFGGSASHSSANTSDKHTTEVSDQGLSMDGIAVMGYYCAINPASPRLDGKDFLTSAPTA